MSASRCCRRSSTARSTSPTSAWCSSRRPIRSEMHPILWTRVADRRLSAPHVRVAVLSAFEHRSFDLADIGMVFKPQTDLYILNAIANHIITTKRVNKDFVDAHTVFKRGQT